MRGGVSMAKCNCEFCKTRRKRNSKIIILRGYSQECCKDYEIKTESPWVAFYAFCVTAAVLCFIGAAYLLLK